MEQKQVFEFTSYKEYLRFLAGPRTERRGVRSAMAKTLRCQSTYVSQVLYGNAHFSLEQAELLSAHFGHSDEETSYFLLLVQKGRAGTKRLETFFNKEIERVTRARTVRGIRAFSSVTLEDEVQARLSSSWHYLAIQVALHHKKLQTVTALAEFYSIPKTRVVAVLEFLVSIKLAIKKGAKYLPGQEVLHFNKDAPPLFLQTHHANWRQQAIESLERETIRDIHYSSVWSISRKEAERASKEINKFAGEVMKAMSQDKGEVSDLVCFNVDFFDISRQD